VIVPQDQPTSAASPHLEEAALAIVGKALAALVADSGFLDHVAAGCAWGVSASLSRPPAFFLPLHSPIRLSLSSLPGFRGCGAGGGGPGRERLRVVCGVTRRRLAKGRSRSRVSSSFAWRERIS
jgi:hypothetical protein